MPKYPWAVRAGGPLLGGGLLTLFDWNPETAQALPGTSTFTRASVAQVLTTTDGTTNWYQEAKSGELRLDGLRRVEQELANADLLGGSIPPTNWTETGLGTITLITSGINGPGANGIRVQGTSTQPYIEQSFTLDAGDYCFAVFVESLTTAPSQPMAMTTNGTVINAAGTATAGRWLQGTFTSTGGLSRLRLGIGTSSADTGDITYSSPIVFKIQDASSDVFGGWANDTVEYLNIGVNGVRYFNTTNGNSVDGNGVVTLATGATITGGGYLSEPAATKRLLHSNDMTQAAWVPLGAATPLDLGATDIGANSTQIGGLGALGVDEISQSAAGFTASGPVAPSVLLQRVSGSGTLGIVNAAGGAANGEWQVDLSLIGAGWVRLEPGANVPGFSEVTPWVADGSGNAGITYYASAGGPLTVNLAFNNDEDGAFATSPIVTGGSPVTRVSDSLSDGVNFTTDWTVVCDASAPIVSGTICLVGGAIASARAILLSGSTAVQGQNPGGSVFANNPVADQTGLRTKYINSYDTINTRAFIGITGDVQENIVASISEDWTSGVGDIGRKGGVQHWRGRIYSYQKYGAPPVDLAQAQALVA